MLECGITLAVEEDLETELLVDNGAVEAERDFIFFSREITFLPCSGASFPRALQFPRRCWSWHYGRWLPR